MTEPAPSRAIDTALFDETVSAGEDFFRHVNGGWLDANPVPAAYGSWGAFHEITTRNEDVLHDLLIDAAENPQPAGSPAEMVGDYYAAAMDEAAIAAAGATPLAPVLERISAAHSVADVRALAAELQRMGASPLHSVGVSPDFDDSTAYMVYLGQGGLGLPDRDYYTRDDERSVTIRDSYIAHVANQLANLGDEAGAAHGSAEAVLAFETSLAEASYTAEQMRDVQLTMNRHDVASLHELMPAFGLTGYAGDLGVTQPTVNIDNAGFFSALEILLAETPIETLRDYLRWQLMRTFASSLSTEFENEAFDFYGRQLGGQQELRPRWKRVLDMATNDIGEQVAQLYVAVAFSEDAKHRCESMVDGLLRAMGGAIRNAVWMTDTTKAAAKKKLAGFSYKIGYPDTWRDYSGLKLTRTSFAENRMAAGAFEYERQFSRLGQKVDTGEWHMAPHQVNAYYHPLMNEVVFPAGILQPPFFYADADDAVNFGAIGTVIGHEITHGFDDRGSHFDDAGALKDWWTEADRTEFDRRAQVLVEQFDAYEVADGLNVNGRLTLGENIADLGGLSIALAALEESLGGERPIVDGRTPEQRFFYSWATVWRTNYTDEYRRLLINIDPHSPARARVNLPLGNIPAFAEAFGLTDESPMVRSAADRAHIW